MTPSEQSAALVGVDTGGTFTDLAVWDGTRLRTLKVLSRPEAPEQAILEGLSRLGIPSPGLRLIHGSTVATNAVLEGKGARTAFITSRGLRDLLSVGRQDRHELYNLRPEALSPPVPGEMCLDLGGRRSADGVVIEALTEADLARIREQVKRIGPQAVAINLLYSFLDDRDERAIEAVMPEGVLVSRSSALLPEIREYERGIATWLNAYVGPRVHDYLCRLEAALPGARVTVMQSSGETMLAHRAASRAVHLLLSGPAGGLNGARFVAAKAGIKRLMTLDMGGTSTDVALIDGEPQLTTEGRLGSYPVAVPMLELYSVGAGGGSIAYADGGGLLRVGPQSAGADPGPACYGRGGRAATVTDAHVVLGRIPSNVALGGALRLDVDGARRAIQDLAQDLGAGTVEDLAEGILEIATLHMSRAMRVVSVERGFDPRDFALMCFGGAGGLHVCDLARALRVRAAIIPRAAGVLSALGMLVAPPGRQLSRTLGVTLQAAQAAEITAALRNLAAHGIAEFKQEAIARGRIVESPSLDLRYRGQGYTLNVPWRGITATAAAFHAAHEQRYHHRLDCPIEIVTARMRLHLEALPLSLEPCARGLPGSVRGCCQVHGVGDAPIFLRDTLVADQAFEGPAIVAEPLATTFVAPGWRCRVDEYANLRLHDSAPQGLGRID